MLKKILLIAFALLFLIGKANANVSGFGGWTQGAGSTGVCPNSMQGNPLSTPYVWYFQGNLCSLGSSSYVPSSGYYSALTVYKYKNSEVYSISTNSAYIDASKNLYQQNVSLSGSGYYTVTLYQGEILSECAYIVDSSGKRYLLGPDNGAKCNGSPLPPTPPIPDTFCTINNANALSVSLGALNRDEIPTVPDSGSAISKTISVVCTGGTVSANMKLNYTPISIGSSQAVKTSANGVGTAIFYDSKALSPSDVTSVNFLEGSNSLTLGFQAVRDSTVALKDIPTGAFTASAVLVMTQQ